MLIGIIEGANCLMRGDGGAVRDLHVVHNPAEGTFTSAWLPTPEELAALNAGAPVYLFIWGTGHPPVYVGVKQE